MISTFSRPVAVRLAATNFAARSMSGLCSGSVLMLGMRRNSHSSSSRRWRFDSTKLSALRGMSPPREIPLYPGVPFLWFHYCYIGEVPVELVVVEPETYYKAVRDLETAKSYRNLHEAPGCLVEEGANADAVRLAAGQGL